MKSIFNTQHASNSLPSPKVVYSGVATTIKRYFKAHSGERSLFSRKPLLPQDVEHMIDVCGINTPQALQSKFITMETNQIYWIRLKMSTRDKHIYHLHYLWFWQIGICIIWQTSNTESVFPRTKYQFALKVATNGYFVLSAAFMLSASFHSGSRGGSFTGPRKRWSDEARDWPLLCQTDHSSGQLKVSVIDK